MKLLSTRSLLLAATCWIAAPRAQAECPSNHFEPTSEFGTYSEALNAQEGPELALYKDLKADVELVLAYYQFGRVFGPRDPDFRDDYAVFIARRGDDGKGLLSLHRLKTTGEPTDTPVPVVAHVWLTAAEVTAVLDEVTPVLLKTHYASEGCGIHYTDGATMQMGVSARKKLALPRSGSLIAGQVFSPHPDSEAGRAVAVGRRLRARVLAAESK